jgi:hypothetical protein
MTLRITFPMAGSLVPPPAFDNSFPIPRSNVNSCAGVVQRVEPTMERNNSTVRAAMGNLSFPYRYVPHPPDPVGSEDSRSPRDDDDDEEEEDLPRRNPTTKSSSKASCRG